jgi:DNA-binding transcriptional MerR regulator
MKPRARKVKNAFTLLEVSHITGLQPAMLNFLIRQQYLQPTYREDHDFPAIKKRRPRGNSRYFSYRDLMIAKTIQRLLNAGVQLIRVKQALEHLRADIHWLDKTRQTPLERVIHWLVTDGKKVYLRDHDGFLELLGKGHQRAFSFIVEMTSVRTDVCQAIMNSRDEECRKKIDYFRLSNDKPIFERPHSQALKQRKASR